jgi:glyoxylase-like metal-dependent hydrolase (beta-lactamase superfamily II)
MNPKLSTLLLLGLVAGTALPAGTEIVPGVSLIRGTFAPGTQPDGNTVIIKARDGLIVIDTGRHVEHAQKIVEFARSANVPIRAVINTHWHLDHIGGNAVLRRAFPGLQVYASGALANARTGFLARYRGQLEEMIRGASDEAARKPFRTEMALVDSAAELGPDVVIDQPATRSIAGRDLRLALERNTVTEGDIWIFDPETGVLIAGDLVTLPAPFLDTACPSRWKETLERLGRTDFELLVPGHGAPLTRRQFTTYRSAFDHLLGCAAGSAEKSTCVEGWARDIAPLTGDTDPKFLRSLMDYYVDMLRRDPASIAKLCGSEGGQRLSAGASAAGRPVRSTLTAAKPSAAGARRERRW